MSFRGREAYRNKCSSHTSTTYIVNQFPHNQTEYLQAKTYATVSLGGGAIETGQLTDNATFSAQRPSQILSLLNCH